MGTATASPRLVQDGCPPMQRTRFWCWGSLLFSSHAAIAHHLAAASFPFKEKAVEVTEGAVLPGVAVLPSSLSKKGSQTGAFYVGLTEPQVYMCPDGQQRAPGSKIKNLAPSREMGSLQPACVSLSPVLLSSGVFTEVGMQWGSRYRRTRHPPQPAAPVGSSPEPRRCCE